jgi:hypothetical protein
MDEIMKGKVEGGKKGLKKGEQTPSTMEECQRGNDIQQGYGAVRGLRIRMERDTGKETG